MGNQSRTNPGGQALGRRWLAVLLLLAGVGVAGGQVAPPLLLPSGLAYDAQGNLYFADAESQVVRRLTPAGVLTVIAGTGTQGFSGDGGPATSATLDNPGALAVDSAGNLLICDTHNHRVRRLDASTGLLTTVAGTGRTGLGADGNAATATDIDQPTALAVDAAGYMFYADGRRQVVRRVDHATGLVATVAGNGVQGVQGDGGPARAASLDSPTGLAVDGAGNLYISDSHNQRVRRVDAASGVITTVAGTGLALRLPRGLAVDSAGGLYIVDAGNHRLRRIDPATGQIATIAGSTVQGFAGDGGAAPLAELNTPRSVALSAGGLATVTDTANARVRQVDGGGIITTLAGVGAVAPVGLSLTGPPRVVYGTGTLTASVGGSARTGAVVLVEGSVVVATGTLSGNTASLGVGALGAGVHSLVATLAGDVMHGALQSGAFALTVTAAPVLATPVGVTQPYGVAIPTLTGSVTGVLTQDVGSLQVTFSSAATAVSGVGSYPISAALAGSAARNYTLTTAPAAVTITRAPSTLNLTSNLLAHLGSGTTGQPGGSITLLDGGATYATTAATPTGDAQFSAAQLSNGSHTLSTAYAGDADFLPSTSGPVTLTITPAAAADFSFAASGPATVTVPAGTDAAYTFAAAPLNGGLSSPIVFAVSGLPSGATATFSPSYLPPGAVPATVTMTVRTVKTAAIEWPGRLAFSVMFGLLLLPRRRARGLLVCLLLCGCGDRVNSGTSASAVSRTYNLTVNATATGNSGATLVHSAPVTLTLQ